MKKHTKKLWKILLVIGVISLISPLIVGIDSAINGMTTGFFSSSQRYYGFEAFIDGIVLFSLISWPVYIIGLILVILSIVKLKKIKNS